MQLDVKERFYSLDFLRGIAAISIVFWHWNHFFWNTGWLNASSYDQLPLFSIFKPFYTKGQLAVELFYSLSGFIFFWLYSEKLTEKTISGKSFFVLRFSRLYPLHFLSLVLTFLLQLIYANCNGNYFVYAYNDLYHFVLNVFFIQSWGFEKGYSFDGPSWSVSIEVMMYVLFFIFCYIGLIRRTLLLILLAAGVFYFKWIPESIQMGFFCFFTGGITYRIFKLLEERWSEYFFIPLVIGVVFAWMIASGNINCAEILAKGEQHTLFSKVIHFFTYLYPQSILFPLTILLFASSEKKLKRIWSKIGRIGDITYSSYLLHFPLQLLFILIFSALGISHSFFTTTISLLIFFFFLILISVLSYRKFEVPIQKLIRNKFAGKNK